MIKYNETSFKTFDDCSIGEWGKNYYGDWMINIQNQNNKPITPAEKFFRYYTQGIHYVFNRALRNNCILEKFCEDNIIQANMFYDAINEMKIRPVPEDVVTYRYIDKEMLKNMLKWSGNKQLKKNNIIFDKAFISTTLTPESINPRSYAKYPIELKINVPAGTPCSYLELISDMHENELLFPPQTKLNVLDRFLFGRYIECIIV